MTLNVEVPGLAPPYPWQRNALTAVAASRASLPHALLLTGPRGHGKSVFARHVARMLLCEAPVDAGAACGGCVSCHLAGIDHHPDLRSLAPLEEEGTDGEIKRAEWISIGQVRELIEFVQLTSHRQRAKLLIIDPADRLTGEAANALLKTLEEPPPETWLLLVSARAERLPATVRSRCRRLPCPPSSAAEAIEWLGAAGAADPALALAQAGGAPLLAAQLAEPALQAERRHLLAALADPGRLSPVALGARIDAVARPDRRIRLGWTLFWMASWVSDLTAGAAGGMPRYCPDFATDLARLTPRVRLAMATRHFRDILTQAALVSHPLSPRLVVERLLLQYHALFR